MECNNQHDFIVFIILIIVIWYIILLDKQFWYDAGNNLLRKKLNLERQYGVAKNVIFFIGDGMSIATLTSARIYMGQTKNNTGSEKEMLSFEKFPFTGLSKVSWRSIIIIVVRP